MRQAAQSFISTRPLLPERNRVLEYVITGSIVASVFVAAIFGKIEYQRHSNRTPVEPSLYSDLETLIRVCPSVQPDVRSAMEDGYVTRGEARQIRDAAASQQRVYLDAVARRRLAVAVGARPVPLPGRCERTEQLLT
ncbi:hypothetical protein [Sphingomonas sp. 3-13AW]|uniref:hypothetical protein n=1 Tax=Sphingomonas sp. 3-13AW TaxID=3050450 RepID=UPI003BB7A19A